MCFTFWHISFCPLQNSNVESPNVRSSRERERMTAIFFFHFAHFDVVYSNLVVGEFSSIFQVKHLKFGMISKELQNREVIFLNDVLAAVDLLVS